MADEPNSKMDELLKAYARKRREDAEGMFEMHPATRRMLQGEVAREHKKKPVRPQNQWLSLLPRLGFAFSIAIVLAVVVWSLRPPRPHIQMLTKSETPRPEAVRDREVSEADAPLERSIALADKRTQMADEVTREVQKLNEPQPDGAARKLEDAQVKLKQMAEKTPPAQAPAAPAVRSREPSNRPQIAQEPRAEAGSVMLADKDSRKSESDAITRARNESGPAGSTTATTSGARTFAQNGSLERSDFAKTLNAGQITNTISFYSVSGVAGGPAAPGSAVASTNAFLGIVPLTLAAAKPDDSNEARGATLAALDRSKEQALNFADTSGADVLAAKSGNESGANVMRFKALNESVDQVRQRFYSETAQKEASASTVLQNFDLYQSGDRVRLVDADGSIYDGVSAPDTSSIETLRRSARPASELERRDPGRPASEAVGSTNRAKLTLRASGTNRTVNQLVVINANLVSDSPSLTEEAKRAAPTAAAPSSSPVQGVHSVNAVGFPQPLRLEGKARIGATNEMRIEAIRVTR